MRPKDLFQYNKQHNCKEIKCNEMNTVPHQYLFHLLFTLIKIALVPLHFWLLSQWCFVPRLCAESVLAARRFLISWCHLLRSRAWGGEVCRRRRRISWSDKLRTWDRIASCNHHSQTYFEMKTTTKQPPTSRQYSKAWNIYRLTTEPHFILKY